MAEVEVEEEVAEDLEAGDLEAEEEAEDLVTEEVGVMEAEEEEEVGVMEEEVAGVIIRYIINH
jgi:hypothetical protein